MNPLTQGVIRTPLIPPRVQMSPLFPGEQMNPLPSWVHMNTLPPTYIIELCLSLRALFGAKNVTDSSSIHSMSSFCGIPSYLHRPFHKHNNYR